MMERGHMALLPLQLKFIIVAACSIGSARAGISDGRRPKSNKVRRKIRSSCMMCDCKHQASWDKKATTVD